jgi:hypothetical protein
VSDGGGSLPCRGVARRGVGEASVWFGGPPQMLVVYPDTRSGEAVAVDRVIPRHK